MEAALKNIFAQINSIRIGSMALVILSFVPVLFWYFHLASSETETLVFNGKYQGMLSEIFLLGFFVGCLTLVALTYVLPQLFNRGGQSGGEKED
jgi:hypothetical protein